MVPTTTGACMHARIPGFGQARRRNGRSAFTLVELLVVVGIIALLITILMPSLERVRAWVNQVMCQNNHHVLTTATRLYTADWNQHLPFSNWLSQEDGRTGRYSNWNGPGWLYKFPRMEELEDIEAGSLWQYIGSHNAYRCPADKPPYKGKTHAITSYMMNGAVTGYGSQLPAFQVTEFRADAIIYWEVGTGSWNDGSSSPSEDITTRHKDGAVVSCMGAYTEWISFEDYYYEESRLPGRLWCNPDAADGWR